jgi:hypothetical protein
MVCGRQPADPHHLRFAQPRAIGMKVRDKFTVPLCRGHEGWYEGLKIRPLEIAKELWEQTHPKLASISKPNDLAEPNANDEMPQY